MVAGKRKASEPGDDGDVRGGAPIDLEIGATLAGKYRIERLLGRGGMGTVWLCTNLRLGERVAVKVLSGAIANNAEVRARFEREARASAKIKSRYVARVYDADHLEDGRPFLVMEYMEGETLAHTLKTTGALPLADTARILSQVGRGLARAHELGIVHRDIKPDNVFLAHTADDGAIAKVFDFGIVKVADALSVTDDATQEGALLGTPQYMSPEQVEGVATIDLRSDVYSLGVMAYRMLTGKRLFNGETLSTTLMQICSASLPDLTDAVPELPAAMNAWFKRTCAHDRDERFSSALECVDALASAAGISVSPEITVPPPAVTGSGLVDIVAAPVRLEPTTGSSSFSGPQSLTPGGAFRQPLTDAPPRSRARLALLAGAALVCVLGAVALTRTSRPADPATGAQSASAASPLVSTSATAALPPPSAVVTTPPREDTPDAAARGSTARPPPRRRDVPRSSPTPKSPGSDDKINDVGY